MLRVWQKREDQEEINNLETYLLTICRRLALDRAALKEAQNLSLETHPADALDSTASPHDTLAARDRLEWVHRILDTLPEKQRTIIQLRDIEERSVSETAEILSITPEDVKTTHHRARRTIKNKLEEIDNHGL